MGFTNPTGSNLTMLSMVGPFRVSKRTPNIQFIERKTNGSTMETKGSLLADPSLSLYWPILKNARDLLKVL